MIVTWRLFYFVCFIIFSSEFSFAWEIDKSLFADYKTALVIYDESSKSFITSDTDLTKRRIPPCSTFKIYNTLIGLELGLIKAADEPWYRWDGINRSMDLWNKDMTLREAFSASALPAFQVLAVQIGEKRMKKYLKNIHYGNMDISAGIDSFWLPGPGKNSIMISADEQIVLLNRLLNGKLPFSKENVKILHDIMQTVKTDKGTLYGKTGSYRNDEGKWTLGWFVGFLESNGKTYTFACNITEGDAPSGRVAREIVVNVFKSIGLL